MYVKVGSNIMVKIKLHIDETSYKQKPEKNEIGSIKKRLSQNQSLKEITVEELFSKHIPSGHTLLPAVMNGGVKSDNFVQQELIIVDVDQDNTTENIISVEETIEKLEKLGLTPVGYHYSFTSTTELPKYHIIFRLNKPVKDINKMSFIINILIKVIGNSDTACKDAARIFFTTNGEKQKVVLLNKDALINIEDIFRVSNSISKNDGNNKKKILTTNDYDLEQAINNYDFLSYIRQSNEIDKVYPNYITFKKCPICGHSNCFVFYKESNSFYCFGKNGLCGGSIIDYIMKINKLDRKEATKFFIYDLLKWPKKNFVDNPVSKKENKQYYLNIIKNQMKSIKFESEQLNDLSWIEEFKKRDGSTYKKINCPKLYDFIKNNVYYIFVRNHAKGGILRFFYIDGYYKLVSNEEIKGIIKTLIPLELCKVSDINEVFNLLITDLKFIPIEELNKEEKYINFKNGLLNLETRKLEPHSPKYLITTRINCNYIENVPIPITGYFDKYMDDLTDKNNELKQLYLQIIGVIISNICAYRMKKAIFQVGERNTGKSRLKIYLKRIIGEQNFSGIGLKELESRFGRIELLNKRLVGSNDLSFMDIKELEIFKQATGGDAIYAEYKGENSLNITFKGVLWFCCNKLPNFTGDRTEAVYSRIIVIECKNIIPYELQDKFLDDHLFEETEYVISLAIKALYKVIDNGYRYDIPDICEKWKNKYRVNNHSFLLFMEDCVVDRPISGIINDDCTTRKFYEVYREWCKFNVRSGKSETKKEINSLLNNMGKGERIKTNSGYWYYRDITLSDDVKQEYYYIHGN